uniref:Copia protein n=1 Tax=Ananas comosus var. bracteatus TaxID=296719 RepID=A0A6V7QDH7_ANACO|nr:unnamed protein product [Ananas comosus var. bracteatus]
MDAVDRILRYLKSTPGKGILFSNHGHLKVEGYTDADWAGSADNRRSTSGYLTFVGGNLVTWRSKKQPVVARSSAEAEFRGMAFGLCELLWLKNLLKELGFGQNEAMKLHCDNTSAIEIAHNPVQHDRTKHGEIDRHFIKEKLEAGIITFPFVREQQELNSAGRKQWFNHMLEEADRKFGGTARENQVESLREPMGAWPGRGRFVGLFYCFPSRSFVRPSARSFVGYYRRVGPGRVGSGRLGFGLGLRREAKQGSQAAGNLVNGGNPKWIAAAGNPLSMGGGADLSDRTRSTPRRRLHPIPSHPIPISRCFSAWAYCLILPSSHCH